MEFALDVALLVGFETILHYLNYLSWVVEVRLNLIERFSKLSHAALDQTSLDFILIKLLDGALYLNIDYYSSINDLKYYNSMAQMGS